MNKNEDAKLVMITLEGDLNGFEVLVSKYEGPVFNAAYRILGDYEQARDAAQTAFIKAFEQLKNYNSEYKFFSWIYRITINESINLAKRQGNRRSKADMPIAVAPTQSPEDKLRRNEINRCIQDALNQMDPKYRVMIVLKHVAECSYREISQVLDLPEKVVKSRLFRARKVMRKMLLRGDHSG